MQLRTGLDLLHRRIEEWTEKALIEPDCSDREVEAFREYGSELVAFLHELSDTLDASQREIAVAEKDSTSAELNDELIEAFYDEWQQLGFGEQPAGIEIDELRDILEVVTDVLEAPVDDAELELEEAVEGLDEFVASIW